MSVFSWRRTRAIFLKEFKHIVRDPFTLMMALMLPLLIVLILGSSIEFNIKSIQMAYVDNNRTMASRKLVETFGSSGYFRPYDVVSADVAFDDIVSGRARVGLIIPPQFEKDIGAGVGVGHVQLMVDGTESSTMSSVSNYLMTINRNAYFKIMDLPINIQADNPQYKIRYLFNPELNSRWFAVPGLSAVIIALVAIMLTTLTICREWERGSMEMLLSTPATRLDIIVGKVAPYAILSFIGFVLVFVVARIVFGVPFVGAYWQLILGTWLFIIGYLAIGLLISVSTKRQEIAIQYAAIIGLLPTVILSGFVFPIEYMSRGYRIAASVFPARFYMDITRDQFLKGSEFIDIWWLYAILAGQAVLVLIFCVIKFKRSLE
ncbi:MAG: ABC transporter permease [Alphaproteobacteria bacterium]|nr:ABC transporter permease [Alphaproteobacteria bacterium]